ncbi:MAG: AI-2E family transporter [Gammaproteobacteria bacterium]|nr:AI-2E family transporter [Gammaproteobacteria bacterium]
MRFLEVISGWVNRYFSNEEAIYLVALLVVGFLVLFTLGGVLAPVLTGLVLAFLLQGLVKQLVDWRVPEAGAVWLAFLLFIGVLTALALFVAPLVWQQLRALVEALPGLVGRGREAAGDLALAFPELLTEAQITQWLEAATNQVGSIGASALEALVANLSSMVGILIYLVLVPISVFFFLKDRRRIMGWLLSAMPKKRSLIRRVGEEMNQQLANYVRGKFIEILIVGFVTFVTFTLLGLNYAALLGVLVGVSVLIPFVGAAVVTIPVALVGIIQFGWSWELAYVMAAYGIIQALDGNVLVPLLFSEAVDLHPITIIVAVLAFGGLWGVWGVFFAIPLATLIKAIINAWPREMGVGAEDFASNSRSEGVPPSMGGTGSIRGQDALAPPE